MLASRNWVLMLMLMLCVACNAAQGFYIVTINSSFLPLIKSWPGPLDGFQGGSSEIPCIQRRQLLQREQRDNVCAAWLDADAVCRTQFDPEVLYIANKYFVPPPCQKLTRLAGQISRWCLEVPCIRRWQLSQREQCDYAWATWLDTGGGCCMQNDPKVLHIGNKYFVSPCCQKLTRLAGLIPRWCLEITWIRRRQLLQREKPDIACVAWLDSDADAVARNKWSEGFTFWQYNVLPSHHQKSKSII